VMASAEDRFFSKLVGAELEFKRDAAGKVTHLVLHQGGRQMEGKRIAD